MKTDRIIFRHCAKTVECYHLDGSWHAAVQGERNPRGPFESPGKAVQEGISVAEKHGQIKRRLNGKKKPNPDLRAILRKASK